MKKILIVVASIVVLAIILWFAFASRSTTTPTVSTGTAGTASSGSLSPIYQAPISTTITIGTPKGSVVVNNFYKVAAGAEERFIIIVRNDNYDIAYDVDYSGFSLNIKQAPVDSNRLSAEADLLKILGVSQADACKLNVGEAFPLNSTPGAVRLGLSFCSGGAFQGK